MRAWFLRLRTALAALLSVYLIVQFPALYDRALGPEMENGTETSLPVLRVWVVEQWTGTGMQWLSRQAAAYEKESRVRVLLRRSQAGDWARPGAVPPDMLLFANGVLPDGPGSLVKPLETPDTVRDFLQPAGFWQGVSHAVPLCYAGAVRLVSEQNPSGPALTGRSDADYRAFAAGEAGSILCTVHGARKFAALVESGKGFPHRAEAYGTLADHLLMAGMITEDPLRADYARGFLAHLLSDPAQNALIGLGLLPASRTAWAPEEKREPLLFALYGQLQSAVNAFDEPPVDLVQ